MDMQPLGVWNYGPPALPDADLQPAPSLADIRALQAALAVVPQIVAPVEHYFSPGQYTRKCTIPAGAVVVGKMHRHQHPTFLLSGTCRINTDRGMETITGPHIWISQPGAKRALVTLTECVFATVHLNPTDTQDLAEIEADVIVPESITHEPQAVEHDALQEVFA